MSFNTNKAQRPPKRSVVSQSVVADSSSVAKWYKQQQIASFRYHDHCCHILLSDLDVIPHHHHIQHLIDDHKSVLAPLSTAVTFCSRLAYCDKAVHSTAADSSKYYC